MDRSWDDRLASPSSDLAIVGTLKWLNEDLRAFLATEGTLPLDKPTPLQGDPGTIAGLLIPECADSATSFTRLYASSRLAEQLPLPAEIAHAILDGAGATRYLGEIEAPVVICILDRAVTDETAAEMVLQLRNSRGEPVSLREDVGWRPPIGVEALAFTVPAL